MKRIISIVLASAMTATCAACLSGCGGGASADSADAGEVNVYNWGEYISNGEDDSLDIIKEFEKRTNIKVNYTTYETNEEDRKSTRLNSSHRSQSRMPSSA